MPTNRLPSWHEYHQRKRLLWLLLLLYLPGMMVLIWLASWLGLREEWPLVLVAVVWIAAYTLSGCWVSRLRCPNCRKPFFGRRRVKNIWSRTCTQCGAKPPK